jgi:hypothetical protein
MLAGMPVLFISFTASALYLLRYPRAYSEAEPEGAVLLAALRAGLHELSNIMMIRIVYGASFFIKRLLTKI